MSISRSPIFSNRGSLVNAGNSPRDHVEARSEGGGQFLAACRPAIGAIEHDSGTGDGGEHPSFRRVARSGTYRANGDQTGDPARTRVTWFAAPRWGCGW